MLCVHSRVGYASRSVRESRFASYEPGKLLRQVRRNKEETRPIQNHPRTIYRQFNDVESNRNRNNKSCTIDRVDDSLSISRNYYRSIHCLLRMTCYKMNHANIVTGKHTKRKIIAYLVGQQLQKQSSRDICAKNEQINLFGSNRTTRTPNNCRNRKQ